MCARLVRPAPPASVAAIARRLEATGRAAWLTGECLADLMCGRACRSFTLATAAPPMEIAGLFDRAVPTTPAGRAWQVPSPGGPVDVLPVSASGPVNAVQRPRGLTVWAMAWSPVAQELTDLFGGEADLAAGVLRAAGSARERLADRADLALAVARVCAQHGDAPDEALESALAEVRQADIDRQPRAARGRALRSLIEAPGAGAAVALLARTGLEGALGLTMLPDTPQLLANAPTDPAVRLAVWLRGNRPGRFLRRHRIHPQLSERVIALLAAHPVEARFSPRRRSSLLRLAALPSADREALFWLRTQELEKSADKTGAQPASRDLEALRTALADHLGREAERQAAAPLALDGRAIMEALGVGQSPLVGRALAFLRARVADAPELNEPAALRSLLSTWSADQRAGNPDPEEANPHKTSKTAARTDRP